MPPVPSSRRRRSRSLDPPDHPLAVVAPLPPPTFDPHYFASIPPGCRFMPTDEELVAHYLVPHLASQPLPPNRILQADIYSYHPEHLAEVYKDCGENALYFFTQRTKKYPNGSRPKRSTGTGFWKASGKDGTVICSRRRTMIGSRQCLVFYEGKSQSGRKTNWLMHEYRLNTGSPADKTFEECALCKIYLKASVCKIGAGGGGGDSDTLIDQNKEEATHQPHPVSGIDGMETEQAGRVADTGLEQHPQHQQTSSDNLPRDGQLMGDFVLPQTDQLMSAYPTPQPVNGVRNLNIDQTGTAAYTGHGYEQQLQYPQTSCDQLFPDQVLGDLGDFSYPPLLGDCSYPPFLGDCSYLQDDLLMGECSYLQNDQLMGDCSFLQNDQTEYPTLHPEQNGVITNTGYGPAHIEELGQHPQPSSNHPSLNDHEPVDATQNLTPGIEGMKLEDNGQPQQAGSEPSIWDYLANIADPAQPNFHFDSSDWLYANPPVDEDQPNNQCNNPSTKNDP